MEFKYKKEHDKLDCACPPIDLKGIDQTVYRWVHKNLDHPNDFIPPYIINPSRVNMDGDCDNICTGFALSMFSTCDKAEKKLKRLITDKPMLTKIFGDCIAEGTIASTDGVADNPHKSSGHFNFHEYKGISLKPKFSFLKQVTPSFK